MIYLLLVNDVVVVTIEIYLFTCMGFLEQYWFCFQFRRLSRVGVMQNSGYFLLFHRVIVM